MGFCSGLRFQGLRGGRPSCELPIHPTVLITVTSQLIMACKSNLRGHQARIAVAWLSWRSWPIGRSSLSQPGSKSYACEGSGGGLASGGHDKVSAAIDGTFEAPRVEGIVIPILGPPKRVHLFGGKSSFREAPTILEQFSFLPLVSCASPSTPAKSPTGRLGSAERSGVNAAQSELVLLWVSELMWTVFGGSRGSKLFKTQFDLRSSGYAHNCVRLGFHRFLPTFLMPRLTACAPGALQRASPKLLSLSGRAMSWSMLGTTILRLFGLRGFKGV